MGRTRAEASPDPLQGRLEALARVSPGLREAAAVYGALLPLLRGAAIGGSPPPLTPDAARERLEGGRHLLQGLDLGVDADAAHELTLRLARALEAVRPTEPARRIREALERGDPHAGELLSPVAGGKREAVAGAARARGLDPDMLWTLAQAALRPAFRAWCRALAPLAEGIPWQRASCCVCGAPAVIGELRADGARHLRCGRCGAGWPVRRLLCPWCGNEEHTTLRTLYEEGRRATCRVEACDRCRRYLKVVAAAVPTTAEGLVLEDLATLHLDRVAREHGYESGR